MKVLMYNEGIHDKTEEVKKVYPNGIHGAIGDIVTENGNEFDFRTLENVSDINDELLTKTDVLIWWGHMAHSDVPDNVVDAVQKAVLGGMGLIVLHSGHHSKIFHRLMGTTCSLGWHEISKECVWTIDPKHPIAEGIPLNFLLKSEEVYSERFDIPKPDDVIFAGWFSSGEVFRSGATFTRGNGRIFYFQPGHETYESFHNEYVRKIIQNAVKWVAPTVRDNISCPNVKPLENDEFNQI